MSVQAIAADADSTAANQTYQLTPEQQRRLADAVKAEAIPGLVGAGGFSFLFAVILLAGLQSPTSGMGLREYLLFGGLTAAGLLVMGLLLWRRSRLLHEVRAGQVQRASGHVVWQAGAYRAEVPGHLLNLSNFNLGAGTYQFSFLPRSARVVAAELVALDSPAQAQDELRHALAVANRFNVDDLPAYRQGALGNSGFRRLRRAWAPAAWMLLIALLLLAIFVYVVAAEAGKDLAPLLFIAGIFLGFSALVSALGAVVPTLGVLGGKVASAEGVVHKSMRQTYGRGARIYFYYNLGDHVWSVTPEAYRAVVEGPKYRAYFLPRSKTLVGIEPIE